MPDVKIYGADWCSLTRAALAHLNELRVPYQYVNIDKDKAAARWVRDQNHGKERKPTINIGGRILSEPDTEELDAALTAQGLLR